MSHSVDRDWTADPLVSSEVDARVRRGGVVVALLCAAAVFWAAPWRVSAQGEPGGAGALTDKGPAATDAGALAQQWEDVLLLDAVRYLQLTPAQVQRILPLARLAEGKLTRLAGEEARTVASLDRIALKQREALLQGRSGSLQEQANALFLEKTMRQKREQAGNDLAGYIAPKLALILTPEQIARAFVLANGAMPPKVARRPALLERRSGFVADPEVLEEARQAFVRRGLATRHPRALVDAQMSLPTFQVLSYSGEAGKHQDVVIWQRPPSNSDPASRELARFSQAARKAIEKDQQRLDERWRNLPTLLAGGATPEERSAALRPLVHRMFLSPRLRPVLEEWLRKGGGPAEDLGQESTMLGPSPGSIKPARDQDIQR
jgi:hypothetical protein